VTDLIAALREVVEASRAWAREEENAADIAGKEPPVSGRVSEKRLYRAAGKLEDLLPMRIEMTKPWREVSAGLEVRTPKGEWLEVTATHWRGDRFWVGLFINGQTEAFERDPDKPVRVRTPSSEREMQDAITLLSERFGASIISSGEQYGS
jgi:hypothetical protein